MLKRSSFSGLLLSAAILSTSLLSTSLFAQPAPKTDLKTLAEDFVHYSRVNNTELAKANGEAILASGAKGADILKAFEDAAGAQGYRDVLMQDQRRPELKDTAEKILNTIDEGFRTVARDPQRIRAEIENLGNGPRAYMNSRDRLASAGEFAVPIYLEYLQNGSKQELRPFILRAMGEIGRPLLQPLIVVLQSNDATLRIDIINVLGQIGYPQALPALRMIESDANSSSELKAAAASAIVRIDPTGQALKMSPADLSISGARNYYTHRVSYQPMTPNEKTSPVWYFDAGLKNVTAVNVPTVIWNDVMAMRMSEATLKADSSNGYAVALWNAANLRRELDLPKGEKDPTRTADALDATFYALAAGPQYMNPVLAMALDEGNDALALRAIDVLEKTGGISGLVATADAPLVRALSHSNKAVRYHAAFALARANPAVPFGSSYRVVPILAEALNADDKAATATAPATAPAADDKPTPDVATASAAPKDMGAAAAPAMSADEAASYATESIAILNSLAMDHRSIYNVGEAVPTLIDALKDKRSEVVSGAGHVLGQINSSEGQQALAVAALSETNAAASRVMFFDDLRESAKHTGNALDASAINGIIKVVSTADDNKLKMAAAGALGALNISSNQSSTLILKQVR